MSRARVRKKPVQPGEGISLYFNKSLPPELYTLINENLHSPNGLILEVLSIVVENKEIYQQVRDIASSTVSGRMYHFSDVLSRDIGIPRKVAEESKINWKT